MSSKKFYFDIAKKYAELSRRDHIPQIQPRAKNLSQTTDENAEGAAKGKKEKKSAKQEEKPAKKEKENMKKEEADVDDETDDVYANEPKQKDPFADMPKTTFNMDEFKRVYSNEDTAGKAIPYFWTNFDNEHCSIWFCEYKYSDELTQVFKTCNLISGFYQRLDKLRKNAFGSMCVFGEDNNNTIAGIWVWRGHELAFEVKIFGFSFFYLFYYFSFHLIGKLIMKPLHGNDYLLMMKIRKN
jgi:elongation factor 1-gamma